MAESNSTYVTRGQARWQVLIQDASAMALRGMGTRRAARTLCDEAAGDRVALETAREHFVARLTEGGDVHAEKAIRYLEAALTQGTTLGAARGAARHPLRTLAGR
ncbi:MAG: hypothetical protein JO085_07055 [Acidimicrobiia bacterium]|nr:hypothetical protein [Acidimicrobiia bacterium]